MPHGGRHMFWVDTLVDEQIAIGGKSQISLMTGISSTESRMGLTLMRLILCLDASPLIVGSSEGAMKNFMGIGVASQEAFAALALADPESATDFPIGGWLFRCAYKLYNYDNAADRAAVRGRVIERDLGAKRKLNNGELYLSVTNQSEQGFDFVTSVIGIVRSLYLST